MPKKPNVSLSVAGQAYAAKLCSGWAKLPTLGAHLVELDYGTPDQKREPGCLIVRAAAGAWHLTLKEPTMCLQLRTSAETFTAALACLEVMLCQPNPPWEPDAYAERQRATKKRK